MNNLISLTKAILQIILNTLRYFDDFINSGYKKGVIFINNKENNRKLVMGVYFSPILVVGINQAVFWILKYFHHIEKSQDHHIMVISTSLLLVGFLLHSTEMSIKARGEEKLKELRKTKEWAVMDASIVVGEILFLISGIWSTLTLFYKWDDYITYSFQVSLFLSGVIYLFIVVIASRKAMKYL